MSDVLEGGPQRPPLPRWLRATAAVAVLVAAGAYGVAEARGGKPAPPPAGPTPAPQEAGAGPAASWRIRVGACGGQVLLPRTTAAPAQQRTGLDVLAGGAQLVRVDVDTGAVTPVAGARYPARPHISSLVNVGTTSYLTVGGGCQGPYQPRTLLRLSGRTQPRPVPVSGNVDDVIAGAGQLWVVDYPEDDSTPVVVRRPGGGTLRLPFGMSPVGVAEAGIVGVARRPGGSAGSRQAVTLVDTDTGAATDLVHDGWPVAVGRDFVLWQEPGCGRRDRTCLLRVTDVPSGADHGRHVLAAGRVPLSGAVLDSSGRFAAFLLARALQARGDATDHPGPSADVAVLDLHANRLQVVPGLLLAASSDAGLAFSADGRWLVVSVNHGSHGHLFAWRRGAGHLLRSRARLPGPLVSAPAVLVMADRQNAGAPFGPTTG